MMIIFLIIRTKNGQLLFSKIYFNKNLSAFEKHKMQSDRSLK